MECISGNFINLDMFHNIHDIRKHGLKPESPTLLHLFQQAAIHVCEDA